MQPYHSIRLIHYATYLHCTSVAKWNTVRASPPPPTKNGKGIPVNTKSTSAPLQCEWLHQISISIRTHLFYCLIFLFSLCWGSWAATRFPIDGASHSHISKLSLMNNSSTALPLVSDRGEGRKFSQARLFRSGKEQRCKRHSNYCVNNSRPWKVASQRDPSPSSLQSPQSAHLPPPFSWTLRSIRSTVYLRRYEVALRSCSIFARRSKDERGRKSPAITFCQLNN